jgi:F0F1-type ATP synthase membrane subunit b/b'
MPQLDTVTYLSQLVWTFLIFAVFYAMMVKHILPAISTSIKVRKKKLQHNSNLIAGLEEEEVSTSSSFEQILNKSLSESRDLLAKTVELSSVWLNGTSAETNAKDLKAANGNYVNALGQISAKKSLVKTLY